MSMLARVIPVDNPSEYVPVSAADGQVYYDKQKADMLIWNQVFARILPLIPEPTRRSL
jgi:hypothetical protein